MCKYPPSQILDVRTNWTISDGVCLHRTYMNKGIKSICLHDKMCIVSTFEVNESTTAPPQSSTE